MNVKREKKVINQYVLGFCVHFLVAGDYIWFLFAIGSEFHISVTSSRTVD